MFPCEEADKVVVFILLLFICLLALLHSRQFLSLPLHLFKCILLHFNYLSYWYITFASIAALLLFNFFFQLWDAFCNSWCPRPPRSYWYPILERMVLEEMCSYGILATICVYQIPRCSSSGCACSFLASLFFDICRAGYCFYSPQIPHRHHQPPHHHWAHIRRHSHHPNLCTSVCHLHSDRIAIRFI